jgi:hypothetical protein
MDGSTIEIAGCGCKHQAIASALTDGAVPSPSASDPARNRHRAASWGSWSYGAVRAILKNPAHRLPGLGPTTQRRGPPRHRRGLSRTCHQAALEPRGQVAVVQRRPPLA